MTAAALAALTTHPGEHHDRIRAALAFLARAQQDDGLFAPEWSRTRYHVSFRVLLATAGAPAPVQDTTVRRMTRAEYNNGIYHRVQNGTDWQDHAQIAGTTADSPALAVRSNQLHCVVRGSSDNKLYASKTVNGASNGWSSFTEIAGALPLSALPWPHPTATTSTSPTGPPDTDPPRLPFGPAAAG
ncbi:hypothetical protein ACFVYD_30215, partial [Streptomyces sp. NPDC058301]